MKIQGQNIAKIRDYSKLKEGKTYIIKYAGLFVVDELTAIQYSQETGRNVYIFHTVGAITEDKPTIYPLDIKNITEVTKHTRLCEGKAYIVKLCGYKQILEYCGIYTDHTGKTGFEFYGKDFIRKVLILPEDLQAWSYS